MPHIHEKIDFTTSAYVVYNNKVLLLFHNKFKIWIAPGGHVELDEDPTEAVKRELQEEAGLEIDILSRPTMTFKDGTTDLPAPAFINRHRIDETHEHIDLIYVARARTDHTQPRDHEEDRETPLRWFSEQELVGNAENFLDHAKHYALEALKIAGQHD